MSHILIIGAAPKSLVNFRGDLIRTLISSGHHVTAMAAPAAPAVRAQIESLGAVFRSFPVERSGLNPLKDLRTFFSLYTTFCQTKPDIILAYTIKPVIWGGLAAMFSTKASFVALVEGLGFAFQQGGVKRKILGFLVKVLYKIALYRANNVVFLNPDNERVMLESGLVASSKAARINGIGVNLDDFLVEDFCMFSSPTFLLIARLLNEKGIREYARAAQSVKARYPDAVFNLLGPEDPSPDGVPLKNVQKWHDQGVIRYLGTTSDVRPYLADCHVYVLPSYHEGMPRTVMEAMATGRPVLTTDAPGCRETVLSGENGFLVPVRDADALAERMIWFIENRDQWERMGKQSREMAEERFDVRIINRELMSAFGVDG
jgi:glycosyltransferase involved in cell wall biosynthesis